MARSLSTLMNIFKDDSITEIGFTLDDLTFFKFPTDEGHIYLAYKTGDPNPCLLEVDMDKLRLALHLTNQMREAKDWSLISPIHSEKIRMDVENLRSRLKDISWLQKK